MDKTRVDVLLLAPFPCASMDPHAPEILLIFVSCAVKAYTEWMPIRWNFTATPQINQASDYAINRTFTYGDLATIFMLEDRVTTRTNAGGSL